MSTPVRTGVRIVVRIAVSLGLGVLVFLLLLRHFGGAPALGDALRGVRPIWLGVALLWLGVAFCTAVQRWRLVLAAMGYSLEYGVALRAVLSAMPLSVIAPSRANDLLRARAIQAIVPPSATIGSVLAERAIDVQSLSALAAVGAASIGQWKLALIASAVIGAEWGIIALLMLGVRRFGDRWQRHRERSDRLLLAFRTLLSRPRALCGVMLTSLAAWFSNVALLYALTQAFAADVGPQDVLALWPLALFVGLLPVTFGGFGTRDAAFVYLLEAFGSVASNGAAVLAATLSYAIATTWGLAIVGLPFMVIVWSEVPRPEPGRTKRHPAPGTN